MSKLRLKTLGGLLFQDDRGHAFNIPTRKTAGLLAFLGMQPGKKFRRESLASMFWGDKSDANARHSLSQALSDIRRIVCADVILSCGQFIWANEQAIEADALDVMRLVNQNEVESLHAAEQLYQGEFLAGMELEQGDFDGWLMSERERLRQLAHQTIGALLVRCGSGGDLDAALRLGRAALNLDPYDEIAHCAIMRAYASQGRKSLAINHFRKLTADLRDELDVEPSEETIETYRGIVAGRDFVVRPAFQRIDDYAFVIEQLPHPVIVTDPHNRIVGWNELAEHQHGFSKSEVQGRTPSSIFAPGADAAAADAVMQAAIEKGRWTGRVTLTAEDGRPFQQQRVVAPLYHPDGQLIGAFGYGISLTDAGMPAA